MGVREELIAVPHHEVADPDGAGAAFGPESFVLHWPVPGKRLESWRALEQVYLLEAETLERGIERPQDGVVAMVDVPELRRDEDLVARGRGPNSGRRGRG
jgi:hypothetical protein